MSLDALERTQLIANLRGALELQLRGRLFHPRLQLCVHFAAAAFKHLHRGAQVFGVKLFGDEADAGRRAASDLVLQAGPAAVGEERIPAIADAKQLLDRLQRFFHRARAGERPEVTTRFAA